MLERGGDSEDAGAGAPQAAFAALVLDALLGDDADAKHTTTDGVVQSMELSGGVAVRDSKVVGDGDGRPPLSV